MFSHPYAVIERGNTRDQALGNAVIILMTGILAFWVPKFSSDRVHLIPDGLPSSIAFNTHCSRSHPYSPGIGYSDLGSKFQFVARSLLAMHHGSFLSRHTMSLLLISLTPNCRALGDWSTQVRKKKKVSEMGKAGTMVYPTTSYQTRLSFLDRQVKCTKTQTDWIFKSNARQRKLRGATDSQVMRDRPTGFSPRSLDSSGYTIPFFRNFIPSSPAAGMFYSLSVWQLSSMATSNCTLATRNNPPPVASSTQATRSNSPPVASSTDPPHPSACFRACRGDSDD